MAWPNQDTNNPSFAGTLLVSNAVATGITSAASLPPLALLQEVCSNFLVEPPPAWTLTALTGAIATTSSIKSSGTLGVGYATGAGGTVTQASNKTTAVVLNKICGNVVTHNAEMLPGVEVAFTVTNTLIAAADVVIANAGGAATTGAYGCFANKIASGTFDVTLSNLSAVSLTEAVTVNFAIIKAVIA